MDDNDEKDSESLNSTFIEGKERASVRKKERKKERKRVSVRKKERKR